MTTVDHKVSRIRLPGGYLEWRHCHGGTVEVVDIEVENDRRRTGVGRRLMETLFNTLRDTTGHRQVYAITRADNRIAQRFYEGLVFKVSGVLRDFYDCNSHCVDAVLYCRNSGGPV